MNAVPILDPGGAELRACGGPLSGHPSVTFRDGGCIALRELARPLQRSLPEISDQIQGNARRSG